MEFFAEIVIAFDLVDNSVFCQLGMICGTPIALSHCSYLYCVISVSYMKTKIAMETRIFP